MFTERLAHQVKVALHHGDRIVDLVSDAGGELPDGRQLLRLDQLQLRLAQRRVAGRQFLRPLGHFLVQLVGPALQAPGLLVHHVEQVVQMVS